MKKNNIDFLFEKDNKQLVFIAGPCAIISKEHTSRLVNKLEELKIDVFRGGAYKPRTSPYSFQGLGLDGLKILAEVDILTISEITSIEQIDDFIKYVDIIQVGARNMANYELLKALGKINKPILLKRGFGATIEEWLCAAEYIKVGGNNKIILCERGIRTFNVETRFTLDLSSLVYIKKISQFPIIVDPSHASGNASLVKELSLAAIASGADGLMIEVDDDISDAKSDVKQTIDIKTLKEIIEKAKAIKEII